MNIDEKVKMLMYLMWVFLPEGILKHLTKDRTLPLLCIFVKFIPWFLVFILVTPYNRMQHVNQEYINSLSSCEHYFAILYLYLFFHRFIHTVKATASIYFNFYKFSWTKPCSFILCQICSVNTNIMAVYIFVNVQAT